MKIFIGLGNPGKKYEKTRHNAGCAALDFFDRADKTKEHFFLIGREKNAAVETAEYEWVGEDMKEMILCVWPQLYMNRSGEAVRDLVRTHGKKIHLAEDVIVLHDDMDISVGTLKITKDSSSGGHKGVQNIIDQLKTKNFIRFRIGIRPLCETGARMEDFVLKKFSKEEEKALDGIYETVSAAIRYFLTHGLSKTQNIFNKK